MKYLKDKIVIAIIAILLIGLPVLIWQINQNQDVRQRASTSESIKVMIDPATAVMQVGAEREVNIVLDAGTKNIGSFEFEMDYTTAQLEILGFETKSGLNIINETSANGNKKYTLANIASTPVAGVNTLATLRIKANAVGTGTITLKNIKSTATGIYDILQIESGSVLIGTYTIQSSTSTPTTTSIPSTQNPVAVQTLAATEITATSARLSGLITTNQPSADINAQIGYTTNSALGCNNINSNYLKVVKKTTTSETVSYNRTGLAPGTTYYYCIRGTVNDSISPTIYGQVLSFTTLALPSNTPTVTTSPSPSSTVRISGMHANSLGAPFSDNVAVGIQITNLSTNQTQTTTAKPNWSFNDLPRANYRVTVSPVSGYTIKSSICNDCNFHPDYNNGTSVDIDFVNNPNYSFANVYFQYTQIPNPNAAFINVSVSLPGIATNIATAGQGTLYNNTDPIRKLRSVEILIGDSNGGNVTGQATGNSSPVTGNLSYDASTYTYKGNVDLQNLPNGIYQIYLRLDNTLYKRAAGFVTVTKGQTANVPLTALISGDIDKSGTSDNDMTLDDYTLFMACYREMAICTPEAKLRADLDDNGTIDTIDLNIMQRGFAIREGDSPFN